MDELVSVIILTYKNLEYLNKAVTSVLKQNYENIEIIISDDGSNNFDYDKIKKMFDSVPRNITNIIINTNDSNIGTVKNFNKAINLSSGKIIVPLSCDDELEDKNVIYKIKKYFDETDYLVVTAKRKQVDENEKVINILPVEKNIEILKGSIERLLKKTYERNFICGACTYYKRSVFDKYGIFDERFILIEDYPFYLNLLQNGEKIGFIDLIAIKYRLGGVSSGNTNKLYIQDRRNIDYYIKLQMKHKVGHIRYRRVKYNCYKEKLKENGKIYAIAYIKYFDILFLNLCNKLKNRILRNEDN